MKMPRAWIIIVLILFSCLFYTYGSEIEGDADGLMFPFGPEEGDSALPPNDDLSSGNLTLARPFPFFDQNRESIYVNTNGVLSFLAQISAYTPKPFPISGEADLVAVFWADVNVLHNGSVWYREVASRSAANESLFVQAETIVRQGFDNQTFGDFVADWIFIATWDKVPYFKWSYERQIDTITNTFQAVLVSDGLFSFAIFNYDNISWTTGKNSGGNSVGQNGVPAVVGVNAGDGFTFLTVPNSRKDQIVDIDQDSNVNTTGRFVFRVDSIEAGDTNASRQSEVRLVDGSNFTEGRVEVFANGVWGTVCGSSWGSNEADVVCRQLGFKRSQAAVSATAFGPGDAGQGIHLDGVECIGDEQSLLDCRHNGLGVNTCSHDEDVGVQCKLQDIRLVNGSKTSEGRLEVLVDGVWATVCGNHLSWDLTDAGILCRDLGFHSALEASSAVFGVGEEDQALYLDLIACEGQETSLSDCPNHNITVPGCYHEHDAGVRCQALASEALEGVRLANGLGPHEGRVEVFALGNWGTVCGTNWDTPEGFVVCRQMGYNNVLETESSAQAFGEGTGKVLLAGLRCSGNEKHFGECYHREIGDTNCMHVYDAGVVCYNAQVRLMGGSSISEGRVEVFSDRTWGTVCGSSWDLTSANVTCRQLGFIGVTEALTSAPFGYASDDVPILLHVTSCAGDEDSIFDCQGDEVGNDCSHSNDAGVRCDVGVRLVGGVNSSEGRVEVFARGGWGTVCDDDWDVRDAEVICRQLGFQGALEAVDADASTFGQGASEADILLDEVSCTGEEETIFHCQHAGLGISNCQHTEDAGVRCDTKDIQTTLTSTKAEVLTTGTIPYSATENTPTEPEVTTSVTEEGTTEEPPSTEPLADVTEAGGLVVIIIDTQEKTSSADPQTSSGSTFSTSGLTTAESTTVSFKSEVTTEDDHSIMALSTSQDPRTAQSSTSGNEGNDRTIDVITQASSTELDTQTTTTSTKAEVLTTGTIPYSATENTPTEPEVTTSVTEEGTTEEPPSTEPLADVTEAGGLVVIIIDTQAKTSSVEPQTSSGSTFSTSGLTTVSFKSEVTTADDHSIMALSTSQDPRTAQSSTSENEGNDGTIDVITQASSNEIDTQTTRTKAEVLSTGTILDSTTKYTPTESEVTSSGTEEGTAEEYSSTENIADIKLGTSTERVVATNTDSRFSTESLSTSTQSKTDETMSGSVQSSTVTHVGGSSGKSTTYQAKTSSVDPNTHGLTISTSKRTTAESTTDRSMSTKSKVTTEDDNSIMESSTSQDPWTDAITQALTPELETFPCLNETVKQSCRTQNFVDCVHDGPGRSHCANCLDGWTFYNGRCQRLRKFIGSAKLLHINGTVATFTEELRNNSSPEFTALSTDVQKALTEATNATTSRVLSFTNGSIVVEYQLLFPETSTVTEAELRDAILDYFSGNSALLDLDLSTVVVVDASLFCEFDSCVNGTTCSINNKDIECTCAEGYTGSNCTTTTVSPPSATSTGSTPPDLSDAGLSMGAVIAIAAAGAVIVILVIVVVIFMVKCSGKTKVVPLNPDRETQTARQAGQ